MQYHLRMEISTEPALITHVITVQTPDGEYVIECPTFQGPEAAKRRVLFSMMARFGYEPEDMALEVVGRLE